VSILFSYTMASGFFLGIQDIVLYSIQQLHIHLHSSMLIILLIYNNAHWYALLRPICKNVCVCVCVCEREREREREREYNIKLLTQSFCGINMRKDLNFRNTNWFYLLCKRYLVLFPKVMHISAIVKIGYGHLWLRGENIGFNDNCII
jgi:hypothetical protein